VEHEMIKNIKLSELIHSHHFTLGKKEKIDESGKKTSMEEVFLERGESSIT
jgi:hypothetical protein